MDKYFRTEEGKLVNLIEHTLEQISLHSNLKIYIGSDSQVYNPLVRYVTVVVFRYGERGAHYVYLMQDVPLIKDDFLRLYTEGWKTVQTSQMLVENLPAIDIASLEFDYADVKKTISSPLVAVFKGYRNARFKSGEMIATKAADHIVRKHKKI